MVWLRETILIALLEYLDLLQENANKELKTIITCFWFLFWRTRRAIN